MESNDVPSPATFFWGFLGQQAHCLSHYLVPLYRSSVSQVFVYTAYTGVLFDLPPAVCR